MPRDQLLDFFARWLGARRQVGANHVVWNTAQRTFRVPNLDVPNLDEVCCKAAGDWLNRRWRPVYGHAGRMPDTLEV